MAASSPSFYYAKMRNGVDWLQRREPLRLLDAPFKTYCSQILGRCPPGMQKDIDFLADTGDFSADKIRVDLVKYLLRYYSSSPAVIVMLDYYIIDGPLAVASDAKYPSSSNLECFVDDVKDSKWSETNWGGRVTANNAKLLAGTHDLVPNPLMFLNPNNFSSLSQLMACVISSFPRQIMIANLVNALRKYSISGLADTIVNDVKYYPADVFKSVVYGKGGVAIVVSDPMSAASPPAPSAASPPLRPSGIHMRLKDVHEAWWTTGVNCFGDSVATAHIKLLATSPDLIPPSLKYPHVDESLTLHMFMRQLFQMVDTGTVQDLIGAFRFIRRSDLANDLTFLATQHPESLWSGRAPPGYKPGTYSSPATPLADDIICVHPKVSAPLEDDLPPPSPAASSSSSSPSPSILTAEGKIKSGTLMSDIPPRFFTRDWKTKLDASAIIKTVDAIPPAEIEYKRNPRSLYEVWRSMIAAENKRGGTKKRTAYEWYQYLENLRVPGVIFTFILQSIDLTDHIISLSEIRVRDLTEDDIDSIIARAFDFVAEDWKDLFRLYRLDYSRANPEEPHEFFALLCMQKPYEPVELMKRRAGNYSDILELLEEICDRDPEH